ncbi:MAG TPA: methyltransferase, partial [Pirellulaceae bacterium]|nr:methyltransferase [Pirellulaceae bacterium]
FWTPDRKFDLVLANPPYYGNDRLAEIFMTVARRALRPSGQVVAVTKHPDWYREHLSRWFINCRVIPSKRYFIATGQVA